MKLSKRILKKSNRMKCQKQYFTVHSIYKFVSQNEHLFYSITKDYYSPNIKRLHMTDKPRKWLLFSLTDSVI